MSERRHAACLVCAGLIAGFGSPAGADEIRRVLTGELRVTLDAGLPVHQVFPEAHDPTTGGENAAEFAPQTLSFPLSKDSHVRLARDGDAVALKSATLRFSGGSVSGDAGGTYTVDDFAVIVEGFEARWNRGQSRSESLPVQSSPPTEPRASARASSEVGHEGGLTLAVSDLRIDAVGNVLAVFSDDVRLSPGRAAPLRRPKMAGARIGTAMIRALLEPGALTALDGAVAGTQCPTYDPGNSEIGPDIIVVDLPSAGNFGSDGGIAAFSVSTTSCNKGDKSAKWIPETNEHPVIAQNVYRLRDDRFEQIGMSWVKHGFFSVNDKRCGIEGLDSCGVNPGQILGVGCSDPYSATLNGAHTNLGPRSQIDAFSGCFPIGWKNSIPNQTCNQPQCSRVDRRIQVRHEDLDPALNPDAAYFIEGHYVSADDALAGNGRNNASYRPARVIDECETVSETGRFCIQPDGSMQLEKPAIHAWKDSDPSVVMTEVLVPNEGPDETGEALVLLAAKAINRGNGAWGYEYGIHNVNSDRGVRMFQIPLPEGAVVSSFGFHDVEHHSGDPWGNTPCRVCANDETRFCLNDDQCTIRWRCLTDSENNRFCENDPGKACTNDTQCFEFSACDVFDESLCVAMGKPCLPDRGVCDNDWDVTIEPGAPGQPGAIRWETQSAAENENANALRWGTLYNFRFEVNVGPEETSATIGMFKTGPINQVSAATVGPALGLIDCNGNTLPDACDLDCDALGCEQETDCTCDDPKCEPRACGCSADCNSNGVPDECEPDCLGNGIPDQCDVDDCPPGDMSCADCNGNGVPDGCDLRDCPPGEEWCEDCNENGVPDGCEPFQDCDGDGVQDCRDRCPCTTPPDACECPPMERCECDGNAVCEGVAACSQISREACLDFGENCIALPDCAEVSPCRDGCVIGDMDGDGDVDLKDWTRFDGCYSGKKELAGFVAPSDDCLFRFDFDADGDVDEADTRGLIDALAGPQ